MMLSLLFLLASLAVDSRASDMDMAREARPEPGAESVLVTASMFLTASGSCGRVNEKR
jgi:hypothetical protein